MLKYVYTFTVYKVFPIHFTLLRTVTVQLLSTSNFFHLGRKNSYWRGLLIFCSFDSYIFRSVRNIDSCTIFIAFLVLQDIHYQTTLRQLFDINIRLKSCKVCLVLLQIEFGHNAKNIAIRFYQEPSISDWSAAVHYRWIFLQSFQEHPIKNKEIRVSSNVFDF